MIKRVAVIFGTRPEIIKQFPVIQELRDRGLDVQVGHSGQHTDLADPLLSYFDVLPNWVATPPPAGRTLTQFAGHLLPQLQLWFRETRPDVIVVQGDTSTAYAGALAAFYEQVPVVHNEAGLRTGDIDSPWPEEFHRRSISLIARQNCVPTQSNALFLMREGVSSDRVHLTGNTVVDSLIWTAAREQDRDEQWRAKYGWTDQGDERRLVIATLHRRESFGQPLRNAFEAICELACTTDVQVICPIHPNPNVKRMAKEILGGVPNIRCTLPIDYPEFVWLLQRAHLAISDSGGIQEEAPSLGVPLLIARENTERPEVVEAGAAILVGTNRQRIVREGRKLLEDAAHHQSMSCVVNPFGDGTAAIKIADVIQGLHQPVARAAE